jgi:thiol-disulfide isomerase/thioredoxin
VVNFEAIFMNRRELLSYLGFGGLGLTGSVIAGCGKMSGDNSTSSAITSSPAIAAKAIDAPLSSTPSSTLAARPSGRQIPEIQGIETWLNSSPIKLSEQKGKVILLQFWTFGCINCQRTLPSIIKWHKDYASQGLLVVSVHAPELLSERSISNVKRAVQQRGITYPVAIDSNFVTWKAFENQYWPHLFLADRQGILRYDHIGEGAYEQTEQKIRELLSER